MSARPRPRMLIAVPDRLPPYAHAVAGPPVAGVRLCRGGCAPCEAALAAVAAVTPGRLVRIRTTRDRLVVTAAYLTRVLGRGGRVDDLRYLDVDPVLWVELCGDERLLPGQRWWSLVRWEDACARGRIAPPVARAERRTGRSSASQPPRHAS